MRSFNLPDLGEGLSEAEIVTWHVSAGDRVVVDQPLVSVETDKAVVEVPSPYSGTIAKLHAAAGDIVRIGNPLVDFAYYCMRYHMPESDFKGLRGADLEALHGVVWRAPTWARGGS